MRRLKTLALIPRMDVVTPNTQAPRQNERPYLLSDHDRRLDTGRGLAAASLGGGGDRLRVLAGRLSVASKDLRPELRVRALSAEPSI